MANSRKYAIGFKTESTDASPSALQGTKYWYDTGTTENDEAVYYDNLTGLYAKWTDADGDVIISGVADVGGTPTDYFRSIPETIEVSDATFVPAVNGTYTYWSLGDFGEKSSWKSLSGHYIFHLGSSWLTNETEVGIPDYSVLNEDDIPPTSAVWNNPTQGNDDLTLTYTLPVNQYVGQGSWSGTITVNTNVIADAWYRAETTAFDSLKTFTGSVEGVDCYRGFLPVQGDDTDDLLVNLWSFNSGGSDFDIQRLYGSDALWCSMQANARIESLWETRQKAMEFAGLVQAWLKETGNLGQTEAVEWLTLSDLPPEPEIDRTSGINRQRFWRQTIDLELTYKTETVFSS